MPRIYTANLPAIASFNPTADDGIIVLKAPALIPIEIISVKLSIDFAAHETIHAALKAITAEGSIASATAPDVQKQDENDAATTTTLYGANASGLTTEPTTWSDDAYHEDIQGGYTWIFEPTYDSRPRIKPATFVGLQLKKALAVASTASASITYMEI